MTAPAIAAASSQRNVSGSWWVKKSDSSMTGRRHEQGDLRTRRDRNLAGELHLPRAQRSRSRPPCSAALPTIADDHHCDEELAGAHRVRETRRANGTRISLTIAVNAVATASAARDRLSDHAPAAASPRSAARWLPQVPERDREDRGRAVRPRAGSTRPPRHAVRDCPCTRGRSRAARPRSPRHRARVA